MQLALGLSGLPGPEIGLIKSIVRLSSNLAASWIFVESGPCDLLLVGDAPGPQQPFRATSTVRVVQRGQYYSGPALHRPIRAEELIDLLNFESARHTEHATPVPTAPPPISIQGPDDRAQLRRWPPFALLRGRPDHMQLATLLANHALSASRLSDVAARPFQECESFMRELDAHNLLIWHPAFVGSPWGDAALRAPAPMQMQMQPRRSFLKALREKFGIVKGLA